MQLDERLGDRQAEAGAPGLSLAALRPPEAVEDVLQLLLLEARPVVGDRELDLVADLGRADSLTWAPSGAYLLAFVSRLKSTWPIRPASAWTSGRSFSTLTVRLLVLLLEVRPHLPADALGQGSDGGRLRLDPKLARVAARQVEQVVDHLLQLPGALRDHLGRLELPRVERLASAR